MSPAQLLPPDPQFQSRVDRIVNSSVSRPERDQILGLYIPKSNKLGGVQLFLLLKTQGLTS